MENSNNYGADKFQKCPYQSQVYGTDNSDLHYRKAYKGDWGHWDDQPETLSMDQNCEDLSENENLPIT